MANSEMENILVYVYSVNLIYVHLKIQKSIGNSIWLSIYFLIIAHLDVIVLLSAY